MTNLQDLEDYNSCLKRRINKYYCIVHHSNILFLVQRSLKLVQEMLAVQVYNVSFVYLALVGAFPRVCPHVGGYRGGLGEPSVAHWAPGIVTS